MKSTSVFLAGAAAGLVLGSMNAHAEPPNVQTPAPVIYLTDNLDERDNLGFCLDTVGRGLSDQLHAHSCKPQGGDVQFQFDGASGRLASATFGNKCADFGEAPSAGDGLALLDCADTSAQQFTFDVDTGEFRPVILPELCLAVGSASRSAGPFMARDLLLADCSATDEALKRWTVVDAGEGT